MIPGVALAFRRRVGDVSWQAPTRNLPMNNILAGSVLAILLLGTAAPAPAADYKSFFGKTVAFRLAACADGKPCDPGDIRTIQFDARGTLSEAFMLGDRTRREHMFGKTSKLRSGDADTKKEKSVTLSGRDNSIEIVADSTLRFSDGDSNRKVDTYRLTTVDGVSCALEGSRSMVDLPENSKRLLKIVGSDCQIKP
jgi:hypothetical protein